jgi:hypothetical protein
VQFLHSIPAEEGSGETRRVSPELLKSGRRELLHPVCQPSNRLNCYMIAAVILCCHLSGFLSGKCLRDGWWLKGCKNHARGLLDDL